MNRELVPFSDLQELTGYSRPTDVMRCLERDGVKYFVGKNGVYTLIDCLRNAAGIRQNDQRHPEIEF